MATPTTNFYDPGPQNVFIPAAQQGLQVEFSRNPASFSINQYLQIVPGLAVAGMFPEMSASDSVMVPTQSDYIWPDGQERPVGSKRPLRWVQWKMERRTYPFTLGSLTVSQASFDIVAAHARRDAAKCMTDRTIDGVTVMTTAGNWTNTVADVDTLLSGSGLSWTSSSTSENTILKSFNQVKQNIALTTGGAIQGQDLMLVINPTTAAGMAATAEIRQYMTAHERALSVLAGADRQIVDTYGLPPYLYGVQVVVENAVYQSSRREIDGSGTRAFVMASYDAVFLSRPGGLIGAAGPNPTQAAPSMSTLTGFFNEEMSVESKVDDWHRLTQGAVTDTRDIVLTAQDSGYFIQDVST